VNPVIEVDNISKKYGIGRAQQDTMLREAIVRFAKAPFRRHSQSVPFWALKDVAFTGNAGEVIGIVGRNGAGKSTLLKILSKITYPTSGRVKVRGRIASLLEVGTGFHEELTGRENIFLNGTILGMKKSEVEQKLEQIVEFSGVHKFIDTPLKRYSSGMALRLGFAVAAHLEADVLLVDEVLAVGDVEFQKKCLTRMEDLHKSGRTVVFVSHNVAAVEYLCPRTIWIDGGRVREDGPTQEVIRVYLAQFARNQRIGSDLRDYSDRQGTGEVRLTQMVLLDSAGRAKNVVRACDDLTVRIYYTASKHLQNAQFGIDLHTELGTHVAAISTPAAGYQIPNLPAGEGHVEVKLENLNLMPGRYWITLWVTGPNHYNSARYGWDMLERCASLDIESTDFHKSGTGVGREYGFVLFPSKWSVHADVAAPDAVLNAPSPREIRSDP
jgi:lipopolysaccharide transport system ATP-binding protein